MRYNVSTTRRSFVFPVFTLTSSLRFGPSDFLVTGTLKVWTAIPDLPRIAAPTLVLHGQLDVVRRRAVLLAHPARALVHAREREPLRALGAAGAVPGACWGILGGF